MEREHGQRHQQPYDPGAASGTAYNRHMPDAEQIIGIEIVDCDIELQPRVGGRRHAG
jgi:hypothetical protein